MIELSPQPGPQTMFFSSVADIVFYGGSAGGGKTWSLLAEPLRHINNGKFGAVIFRRTTKQILNEGSLWDESANLYPYFHGKANQSSLTYKFPSGASVQFSHMEYEKNKLDWQGSAINLIEFDEITHFTETQFFYMLSRNRSLSGIPPYVRATCNPQNDSWVKELIKWWLGEDGFPIKERSGVVRWFIRIKGELIWADSKEDLIETYGEDTYPKSFTFISALLSDNKILMEKDPGYLANLLAQEESDRQALLEGNWNASARAGEMFREEHFEIIDHIGEKLSTPFRYWDRAGTKPSPTNKDPDWTAGVLMAKGLVSGYVYILDVVKFRENPADVKRLIKETAQKDGTSVEIGLEQDPGQAGKSEVHDLITHLSGFSVHAFLPTGDKVTRAKPFAAQCQINNVKLLRGEWNKSYIKELVNFPGEGKKDQVDASSGAFNQINAGNVGRFTEEYLSDDTFSIETNKFGGEW